MDLFSWLKEKPFSWLDDHHEAVKPAGEPNVTTVKTTPGALQHNQWPLQRDCVVFYGDPNSIGWLTKNTIRVPCPWPLHMGSDKMNSILIHKKCAASLTRVLGHIWDEVGHDLDKIHALKYDIFDGSYNLRKMRGGSNLSMHSFACAIDFDAKDNAFHSEKHLFTKDSLIVKAFEDESWVWGGRWASPDAMHLQAARIK